LQEIYPLISDQIDETVFLPQAAGPGSWRQVFQRLGLANAAERVAQNGFNQIKGPQSDLAVGCYPIAQIFNEFAM
jgi:hypothetical protein